MTRHLAVEWGPQNIRVNSLAPGPISGTEGFLRLSKALRESRTPWMLPWAQAPHCFYGFSSHLPRTGPGQMPSPHGSLELAKSLFLGQIRAICGQHVPAMD